MQKLDGQQTWPIFIEELLLKNQPSIVTNGQLLIQVIWNVGSNIQTVISIKIIWKLSSNVHQRTRNTATESTTDLADLL